MFDAATGASALRSFLRGQTSDFFSPSLFDPNAGVLPDDLHDDVDDVDTDVPGDDIRALLVHAAWPRAVGARRVSGTLGRQLASTLDPPNLLGLDWRQLAAELNLDPLVPHLTGVHQPTAHLLTAAEVLCAGLYELEAVFERMGRDDAAALVRADRARADSQDQKKPLVGRKPTAGYPQVATARF